MLENEFSSNKNYIFLSYYFNPDKNDTKYLMEFVEKGNNVFVATNYFGGKFADTLKLETSYYFPWASIAEDTAADDSEIGIPLASFDSVKINFRNKNLRSKKDYVYAKGLFDYYFTSFDSSNTFVIGRAHSDSLANFIRIKHGKGNFFLHCLPQTFSNYCFTDEKNSGYVYKCLSFLPAGDVIWDEYYKYGNDKKESPLSFIFNNESLLAAYYTILIGLVLFVIFGGKRTQRIIPVIEPLKNTTLEFVDIVGSLYFQQGDHKNIADKKINYFLDVIRTKFHVKTNTFDQEFLEKISALSGIEEEKAREIFRVVSFVGGRAVVTQEELLHLNSVIEDFYKNSKR
jgi:hypothetical protein